MNAEELRRRLKESGALKKGHFRLSSGRHSDTYVQCALLLKEPGTAVEIGRSLADMIESDVDLVLSPALGAVVIGFTTALAIGCDMFFAEREEGCMVLRRGFEIDAGNKVLIVEDVVTTGGSVYELARLAEDAGADVVGIASMIIRGEVRKRDYPLFSLLEIETGSYDPGECPLCDRDIPIDSPGSRHSP